MKQQDLKGLRRRAPARVLLKAVPLKNELMRLTRRRNGHLLAEVPMRRPRWLVPPISWMIPYSAQRRVELDKLGERVLDLCDGKRNVETIVEKFAVDHKLSFREAQLSVTQFLTQLSQRGLIAILGFDGCDKKA